MLWSMQEKTALQKTSSSSCPSIPFPTDAREALWCVCCLCVRVIKLSPAGLVIKLKGTEVPSWQQLGLGPMSPSYMVNTRLLHDAMQSHRRQLMTHCSWVLLRLWRAAAGFLARGIRIATDGEAFIILKRLYKRITTIITCEKCAGVFLSVTGVYF